MSRRVETIVDTPHDVCLQLKQRAAIVVDECVTGNYHLSGQIGAASRKWIETYYDDCTLVEYYRQAYHDLFDAPETFGISRFRDEGQEWAAIALHDHVWRQRRRSEMGWLRHAVDAVKRNVKRNSGPV